MFRAKTVFILGAGSSSEVGLPTGESLKKAIAEKIDIRFEDGYKQSSGDFQIMQAILEHAKIRDFLRVDPNPYLHKAWELRDALPQAISIDNLLDAHQGDELAEACGKFGIVKSILEAERSSKLFCSEHMKKIDFAEVTDTWFATAIGISKSDCEIIKGEIKDLLAQEMSQAVIEINNQKKCHELFNEYWRGLTAGV